MPRGLKFLLTFATVIVLGGNTCRAPAQQPEETAKITHMVPMRDGVRLATDVFLPEGQGPWPVVLSRTPYGRPTVHGRKALEAAWAWARASGYVRVIQDTRGRFGSKGTATVFMTDGWGELQDGYDTLEWIAKQPWCDGNIGMTGGSAVGITQYLAAGTGHPALKTCWVQVACSSLYDFAAYPGGAFRKAMVELWLKGNAFPKQAYDTVVSHPAYDALWSTTNLEERPEKVHAAMVHSGGWYDCFAQGTLNAYDVLQHRGGAGARGHQILIFGPWVHGLKPAGQLHWPAQAFENPGERFEKQWLAHYLGGEDNGIEKLPHVYYYVMGDCDAPKAPGNQWRTAKDWPVPARREKWYLHADGSLSTGPPGEAQASRTYDFDPRNPVPTVGGANLVLTKGPMDQRKVEKRPDVLVFTTPPLEEPMEVTGRVTATLWVSSSAPDTDFTAKLTDVYPDDRSIILCDGILRARYRNSTSKPELMKPGKIYKITIDLWSTSIIFNRGHRLRVDISSSNYPRFEVNPNTGATGVKPSNPRLAHNTIYMDATHPSCVELPRPTGE